MFSLSHTHTNIDRHFPEIVKSCSERPEMYKSIKKRKSKICTNPVLSSVYVEESKKMEETFKNKLKERS